MVRMVLFIRYVIMSFEALIIIVYPCQINIPCVLIKLSWEVGHYCVISSHRKPWMPFLIHRFNAPWPVTPYSRAAYVRAVPGLFDKLSWVPYGTQDSPYAVRFILVALRWRQNGRDSVSNHQPRHCLLSLLFGRRSKKTSKLRVTGLCVGNSPGPVNSPHKGPVTRKMFPFDDVIMVHVS